MSSKGVGGGRDIIIDMQYETEFQAVSPLTRENVFSACIPLSLLHGSETWAPTAPDLKRLCRNDRAMIRWICSVKPHDEVPMKTLYTKLGIQQLELNV